MNKAKGNPDRNGKNVWRPDEGSIWYYKFEADRRPYHGPCHTTDKCKAETLAAQLKKEARYRTKHTSHQVQGAAQNAIAAGDPFVLLLASGECISNIDQAGVATLLEARLAELKSN